MAQVTEADVYGALSQVKDPDLHKDIVRLGFIKDLRIEGGMVSFRVVLTTPACPVREQLQEQARAVVAALPGVTSVGVTMDAEVPKGRGLGEKLTVEGVRNIVAVSSGKGGVGKSTVAVNLAVALAQDGARVVRLMSMAVLKPGDEPMIVRGPILHRLVRQFLQDVEWGGLDYLIVDMPPGTGDVQLSLAQLVPVQGAVLVTTPQEVALSDVRRAIRMFETVAVPVLGIVENMSYFVAPDTGTRYNIFGEGGGQKLADAYNVA